MIFAMESSNFCVRATRRNFQEVFHLDGMDCMHIFLNFNILTGLSDEQVLNFKIYKETGSCRKTVLFTVANER